MVNIYWALTWHTLCKCFYIFQLIFLKLIYFNWRIITLQYCGVFAIHQHESVMGAHVHEPWKCVHGWNYVEVESVRRKKTQKIKYFDTKIEGKNSEMSDWNLIHVHVSLRTSVHLSEWPQGWTVIWKHSEQQEREVKI